jgi:hypothetical protein
MKELTELRELTLTASVNVVHAGRSIGKWMGKWTKLGASGINQVEGGILFQLRCGRHRMFWGDVGGVGHVHDVGGSISGSRWG